MSKFSNWRITKATRSLTQGGNSRMRGIAAVALVGGLAVAGGGSAYAATSHGPAPYSRIGGLRVAAVSTSSATFAWRADHAAYGSTIQVIVYNASTSARVATARVAGRATSATVKGLPAGTALDVKVDVNGSRSHPASAWTSPVLFYTVAKPGAVGKTGPAGPAGPAGPSSFLSVTSLVRATAAPTLTVNTGGSFAARKSIVGTITLKAGGWYLLNLNFKATPNAVTTGSVFPQFFVYSGVAKSDFSNDLFNVGAGALENPTAAMLTAGDVINSYYSGSTEINAPVGGETLYVYAFGYDSDTGAGSYVLNSATATATLLNVAS